MSILSQFRQVRLTQGLNSRATGFTLLEMMVVMLLLTALAAIAAPAWLAFLSRQELQVGHEQAAQAIRQAQINARQHRLIWQFSVREVNQQVQWAIHPAHRTPIADEWQSLSRGIRLDAETSLTLSRGTYQVQFNAAGHVNGALGRLTLFSQTDPRLKRCTMISTLLGAIRSSENQRTPLAGFWCY